MTTAMKGRRLTDLDLLPGGSSHRERPCMPEFQAPLHPLVMQGFTTLFQQEVALGGDGKMTVRSVMKYLVNKLRLNSESEAPSQCSYGVEHQISWGYLKHVMHGGFLLGMGYTKIGGRIILKLCFGEGHGVDNDGSLKQRNGKVANEDLKNWPWPFQV
ncbi:hypothetical protein GQ457_06G005030 [Hibiscus cannabinus]